MQHYSDVTVLCTAGPVLDWCPRTFHNASIIYCCASTVLQLPHCTARWTLYYSIVPVYCTAMLFSYQSCFMPLQLHLSGVPISTVRGTPALHYTCFPLHTVQWAWRFYIFMYSTVHSCCNVLYTVPLMIVYSVSGMYLAAWLSVPEWALQAICIIIYCTVQLSKRIWFITVFLYLSQS